MATGAAIGMGATSFALSKRESDSGLISSKNTEEQYRQNAALASIQSDDAIKRGNAEAEAIAKETRGLIGSQRTAYAAQGIDIESGSALEVQMDTAAQSAEAQRAVKNNAWREAWGYRVEAANLGSQAEMQRLAGKSGYKTGIMTGMFNAIQVGMGTYSAASGGGGGSTQRVKSTDSQFKPGFTPITTQSSYANRLTPSKTGWRQA